ncbi:hypothetical protein [Caulobacter mirabilis]|uniref:Bacterial transcriptional activator domain-containing protein n=1 Tax=Caulobacter mirabilis TaxID=69666 RepID=A0A2D2AXE7_9CAUL|nr:hypothetical protein [Caulobacter mirabilis]ATQ42688.1 hypothetical protein CSW64_09820 [Caulobacter mirabilis]
MSGRPAIAKLSPPGTGRTLARPRVSQRLEAQLAESNVWVAAPAGYGKTTAAVDLVRQRGAATLWLRVDEGDQDVASFFHYLSLAAPSAVAKALPRYGPEYADQLPAFSRRFFRALFAGLPPNTLLVLDDLHHADTEDFRAVLSILVRETPSTVRCLGLSRTLPPRDLADLLLSRHLAVLDQGLLQFSEPEARALVAERSHQAPVIDLAVAKGWAAGLVLLSEGHLAGAPLTPAGGDGPVGEAALFDVLGRQVFETLPESERSGLQILSLLPEITPQLAAEMVGSRDAETLLDRLHRRQLLTTGTAADRNTLRLHDLLRDFLHRRLEQTVPATQRAQLQRRAAEALAAAGRPVDAVELALAAGAWPLARALINDHAEALLDQGRRSTVIDWCDRLPEAERDSWLCYWRGVASLPDDAVAEIWLGRAWTLFESEGDLRGQHLAAARAVLTKTDSWRTHAGLSAWTRRATALLGKPWIPASSDEDLLVLVGMLRAMDFADDLAAAGPVGGALAIRLTERLAVRASGESVAMRLLASASVIEHAGSTGAADLFERAVDSVADDLRQKRIAPWILGLWLVAFGAVSGRYFPYARRGFPHDGGEHALRTAVALGEAEALPAVEFGALYHLQHLMRLRNDWEELAAFVDRLAAVADSRHTTQVAVVADCQAALHTRNGDVPAATEACERFMTAIEAADEPPIERWPHFITRFQIRIAARDADTAIRELEAVLPLFDDGAVAERTRVCIAIAGAIDAKRRGSARYPERLRTAVEQLAAAGWSQILSNLPDLLAEMLDDALAQGTATDFCRRLIAQRRLSPPPQAGPSWPWPLRVQVLGDFGLAVDDAPLKLGGKPATRSLDILRILAVSKGRTCTLAALYDWLWPDSDGDQAKAACEQALHRLRRLVGRPDLVIQREGRLRLSSELVWVDLVAWEARAASAIESGDRAALRAAFLALPGALLPHEPPNPWSTVAADRVRDLTLGLADRLAAGDGDGQRARAIYLRCLELYPDSARVHGALISGRLARDDLVGALEDYARYERRQEAADEEVSSAIRALISPALRPPQGP